MSEQQVRIDPLTGLRVLVAGGRDVRPSSRPAPRPRPPLGDDDPFAEGNEHLTPPEVWADRPGGSEPDSPGWRVRSVPNKFPALTQSFEEEAADPLGMRRGMPELLTSGPAGGKHEVIVNTARQAHSLAELPRDELDWAVDAWATRIAAHFADPRTAYVHLCVNERAEAGATMPHSHAQLFALPFVPAPVARERERMRAYFEHTQGRSLLEDLLIEEVRSSERLVAIDDDCALIAPFASATPYRLMILPRRREEHFEASESKGAGMLFNALAALREVLGDDGSAPPLNLWIRTKPGEADNYTWRIEIAPRLGQQAGFELGTGIGINSVPPETAAKELREALA